MFTRMDSSTAEEWQHITEQHMPHIQDMPKRVISMLQQLAGLTLGFGTDQLHHALQTATMARRAGADEEMILISLVHDIGKVINVPNHGQIAAEIIKPYISDDAYNIIRTHQDFQGEHYYHYMGKPRDLRKQYVNESWYKKAIEFTDEWDQAAFDPSFQTDSLASFEPLINYILYYASSALVLLASRARSYGLLFACFMWLFITPGLWVYSFFRPIRVTFKHCQNEQSNVV